MTSKLGPFLVLATVGCAPHVSPEELMARIEARDAPLILDVRSRGEFEEGHVPGAVHVPFYGAWGGIEQLREANEPVVVYCEHGPRAGIARAALWVSAGPGVTYLEGHMTGWRAKGLPMEVPAN